MLPVKKPRALGAKRKTSMVATKRGNRKLRRNVGQGHRVALLERLVVVVEAVAEAALLEAQVLDPAHQGLATMTLTRNVVRR